MVDNVLMATKPQKRTLREETFKNDSWASDLCDIRDGGGIFINEERLTVKQLGVEGARFGSQLINVRSWEASTRRG